MKNEIIVKTDDEIAREQATRWYRYQNEMFTNANVETYYKFILSSWKKWSLIVLVKQVELKLALQYTRTMAKCEILVCYGHQSFDKKAFNLAMNLLKSYIAVENNSHIT